MLRGGISVQHGGRDLRLMLDFNTLADFEELTGKNALIVLQGLESGTVSATDIRALVFAAMRQTDESVTIRDAGGLLSDQPDVLARLVAASAPEGSAGNVPRPQSRAKK